MRISIWPGVRLSVWEPQNPETVRVTLSLHYNPFSVRRVLSKRGWMLLLVRYDWRERGRWDRIQVENPRNTGWFWKCTDCGASAGKYSTDDQAREFALQRDHPQCPPDPDGPWAWTIGSKVDR